MARAKKPNKKLWIKVSEIQEIQAGWQEHQPSKKNAISNATGGGKGSAQPKIAVKMQGKKSKAKLSQAEVVEDLHELIAQIRSFEFAGDSKAKDYKRRIAELEERELEQKRELKRLRQKNKRLRSLVKELKQGTPGSTGKGLTIRDALEQFEKKRESR